MTIGVLFVCTGNICRSPMAKGVFSALVRRAGLEDVFTVDSAGTSRRTSWLTYTAPRPPPRPAATTSSTAAAFRSVRSFVGPHANSMWRCLILTSCHARGN